MSEIGSAPTMVAGTELPSEKYTVSCAPAPPPATTWLLVRIRPSEDRITPEPSPCAVRPTTSMRTTLGTTFCATACTEPAGAAATVVVDGRGASRALVTAVPPVDCCVVHAPTAPPIPPLTSASATAPRASRPRADRGEPWGPGAGWGGAPNGAVCPYPA